MQFSNVIPQASHFRFAPNSHFFVYTDGKKIYVKESAVDLNNICVISTPQNISDIVISPNSQYIAVFIAHKSTVLVFDMDGNLAAKIQDSQAGISGIIWTHDSVQLIVFSEFMYRCSIYNLSSQAVSYIKGPKLTSAKGCGFTSNGKFMALLQKNDGKDYLGIYYSHDWKLVNCIQLQTFDAVQLLWAPDNSYIVVVDNSINYKVVIVCPFKGIVLRYQPYDYALGVKSIHYSENSFFLAIGSYDEKVRMLNALTWKPITQLDCSVKEINCSQIKVYKEEDTSKNINRMKLIESNTYKVPTKAVNMEKSPPNMGIGLLEFSCNSEYLACRNDNMPYTVWIWNVSRLELEVIITMSNPIKMFKWGKNDLNLCIVSGVDRLFFWSLGAILQCQFPYENRKLNIQKILWSSDSKKVLMADNHDLVYAEMIENDF